MENLITYLQVEDIIPSIAKRYTIDSPISRMRLSLAA